jgi:dipeptidyl-peptidase-4
VRSVVSATPHLVYTASEIDDPATTLLVEGIAANRLTREPGQHSAVAGGETIVVRSSTMDSALPTTAIWHIDALRAVTSGGAQGGLAGTLGGGPWHVLGSRAETPSLHPRVSFSQSGPRRLATAVLVPDDGVALDDRPPRSLPVLLDPYGGPHAQRVVHSQAAFFASQWLADQGFAVVVADGRGTPGRGTDWERAVAGDLAGPVLEDQIDALHGAAEAHPFLDLSRVAIRGWSFGGYLAALAVLRRPDVFHAAVAGAPVTDWRLYDTHYTERYLGDPFLDPTPYDRSSLLSDAHGSVRPLMLVHGLADDNVVAAHTLRLSQTLLEAGRPHTVLPLAGVSHMTPQEVVAENLLLLQVAFLKSALGMG